MAPNGRSRGARAAYMAGMIRSELPPTMEWEFGMAKPFHITGLGAKDIVVVESRQLKVFPGGHRP